LKIWNPAKKVYVAPQQVVKSNAARKPAKGKAAPAPATRKSTDKAFSKLANFAELSALIHDRPDLELKLGYSALEWMPDNHTRVWLASVFASAYFRLGISGAARVPAEAVLHGNRIYSKPEKDEAVLYLDGELYVEPGNLPRYPTGDGRSGGDLVLPFYVGAVNPGKA
jgi:hypothetical protein